MDKSFRSQKYFEKYLQNKAVRYISKDIIIFAKLTKLIT